MMVVIGYNEGNGEQVLFCLNPRACAITDEILVRFSDYSGGAATTTAPEIPGTVRYTHEYDFFGIQPAVTQP